LNRPQTEDARRSIRPAYHGVTAKLQHFRQARIRVGIGTGTKPFRGGYFRLEPVG
jgi:hypothetical protein